MRIYQKIVAYALILTISFFSCSCAKSNDSKSNNTISTDLTTGSSTKQVRTKETTIQKTTQNSKQMVEENVEEKTDKMKNRVVLNNQYTTRYQEINMVTYPSFVFNYPDNWRITGEECNQQQELITLENGKGAKVNFLHYSNKLDGGESGVCMSKVKISKAASSQFIPGFVQATDYSFLGKFMVAKIKTIGELNMKTDRDYTDVDGNVVYAVLPVSESGVREGVRKAISGEYSFWYSSTISFTASAKEKFTYQEKKEVISILNSFRLA